MTIPRPEPSWLTRPFWAAANEHRLVRPVCDRCGQSFFTPQIACPRCASESWTWTESSGHGTVYSCTTVHRAPQEGFATPYVVAIVDLDEGWSMLTNIVGTDALLATIGSPVKVAWTQIDEQLTLPTFALGPGVTNP